MSRVHAYLFVPANRPDRFDKALAAGAGCIIIDLEDAVPPAEKDSARQMLRHWLNTAQASVAVRVNAADTPWFQDDLTVCAQAGVTAVMLPKAEDPASLSRCAQAAPQAALLPLIETAIGFDGLRSLADAPSVERLVFGSIDFQLDLGINGDGAELLFFRSQLVLQSRLSGLKAPVDGVTTAIHDTDRVQADAAQSRRMGFGAKLCIHPTQVAPVNTAFLPSSDDIAWARRVMAAAAGSGGAAATVDGKMVDRPIMLRAQTILEAVS